MIIEKLPWFDLRPNDAIIYEKDYVKIINKIAEFYETNKRNPSPYSKDKEEQKFGCWLLKKKCQRKKNELDSKLEALIVRQFPWFHWGDSTWKKHKEMLNKIAEFYKTNNKRPSKSSEDKEEQKLDNWLISRKVAKKKNTLDPKLEALH